MYKENFPTRIRKARIEAGYTQANVAEITGISQSKISQYERGNLEPNLENLATLAQFYNTSLNWLLGVTIEPTVVQMDLPHKKPIRQNYIR